MGLSVYLYFNFNGIEPHRWEKVYEESKILLERFPIDLTRYKHETKYGLERRVYTTKLVVHPGKDDEYWKVDGDLLSGKSAESYMLRKKEYARERGQLNQKDVLWAEEDSLHYIDGNGYHLFHTKTQGYPYHFAMLAVGMLFESRFPMNAYVTGDIEPWQAEVIRKWIIQGNILSQPLVKPVCMDGPRLLNRLRELYPDKKQLLERYKAVFQGSDEDMLETLLKYEDAGVVREFFFEELGSWDTLSKLGPMRLIRQWLNTTRDLKTAIRYICYPGEKTAGESQEPGKGKFKLEDLLHVVCRMFIHTPLEEREPLLLFRMEKEGLHTIDEMFARSLMLLQGAREDVNFYMGPGELFDTFCEFEPDKAKRKKLKKIIEKNQKENKKYLDEIMQQLEELKKQAEKILGKTAQGGKPEPVKIAEPPGEESMEQVIISSALSQKKEIPEPEMIAKGFSKGFKEFIDRNKQVLEKFLNSSDRKFLLENIVKFSFERGIALVEKAWKDIDNEESLPVLKALLCLAIIEGDEYHFSHWRKYLLENKSLWKYIALDRLESEIQGKASKRSIKGG